MYHLCIAVLYKHSSGSINAISIPSARRLRLPLAWGLRGGGRQGLGCAPPKNSPGVRRSGDSEGSVPKRELKNKRETRKQNDDVYFVKK